jgi:hypothetical protein
MKMDLAHLLISITSPNLTHNMEIPDIDTLRGKRVFTVHNASKRPSVETAR